MKGRLPGVLTMFSITRFLRLISLIKSLVLDVLVAFPKQVQRPIPHDPLVITLPPNTCGRVEEFLNIQTTYTKWNGEST